MGQGSLKQRTMPVIAVPTITIQHQRNRVYLMTDPSIVWWNSMFIQKQPFFYCSLVENMVDEKYIVWNLLWVLIFPDERSKGRVAMSVFGAADEEGKLRREQCWDDLTVWVWGNSSSGNTLSKNFYSRGIMALKERGGRFDRLVPGRCGNCWSFLADASRPENCSR